MARFVKDCGGIKPIEKPTAKQVKKIQNKKKRGTNAKGK